jgi:hypothetical protein
MAKGKSFHWGKQQQCYFDDMKKRINEALALTMPNLQHPFEIEIDASGYAMGVVLMQGRILVCYNHSKLLHGVVITLPHI